MSRELIVTENMTVDGVIEMTGSWFEPAGAATAEAVAEMRAVEERLRATADALLVGRNTFESFRSYWPLQVDDETGVRDYLNRVHKYVLSSTMTHPEWDNTTILRGPFLDDVAELKGQEGGDIVATGSITMVHALNQSGLVDEYRLFMYPAAVGGGRRLFDSTSAPLNLELVDVHAVGSGVILLRYRTS